MMNEILPGLWLGKRPEVANIPTLHSNKINCILTIDRTPLPAGAFSSFKIMFLPANDTPYDNLLKYFEKSINFIEENIESGVLVHWYVTFVIFIIINLVKPERLVVQLL